MNVLSPTTIESASKRATVDESRGASAGWKVSVCNRPVSVSPDGGASRTAATPSNQGTTAAISKRRHFVRPTPRSDLQLTEQIGNVRTEQAQRRLDELAEYAQARTFDRPFAKHALKFLVVESARYQRSFYCKRSGAPKSSLLSAKVLHPQRRSQPSPFMMLDRKPLETLLNDIDLLLDPRQPSDRSQNVLQQLAGLALFQSSAFPLKSPPTSADIVAEDH